MKIKAELLNELGRHELSRIITSKIERQLTQLSKLEIHNLDEKPHAHTLAIATAQLNCYYYLHYLLVDPEGIKPWLIKTPVSKPLSKKQFIEYNDLIIKLLMNRPPNIYYAGLAHASATLNLLSKLEIE